MPVKMDKTMSYGGLENSPGFLLKISQVIVFERFHDIVVKQGLHLGAMSVLIVIESNPGILHGDLAQVLHIKLAQMSKLLRSLETKGLVTRQTPQSDRRSVKFTLTSKGNAFVAKVRARIFERDKILTEELSENEVVQFKQLLRKFTGI